MAHTSTQKPKGRWGNLLSIAFSMVVDGAEGSILPVLFPMMRQSLGLSLGSLGILSAATRAVGAISGPLWAFVAGLYNRKIVLIFVTGVWGLWTVAIGFTQNFTTLLAFSVIAAIGTAASAPIVTEIMGDLFSDEERGRASGVLYGISSAFGIIFIPLFGQLATLPEGWRLGFYIAGGMSVLSGILAWLGFKDPGRGAAEPELAAINAEKRESVNLFKWSEVRELFRVPTFTLMLVSRLLSGHLLMISFGVVYMVDVFGFENSQATLLFAPYVLSTVIGNFSGGWFSDRVNRRSPNAGRILVYQLIQVSFAVFAFFGLQFDWGSLWGFAPFFVALGFLQGLGPGFTCPILISVTLPEMRSTAFALFVSVFEALAWAIYNLLGGFLGERFGLQPVFLAVLVVLMLVNALFIFTLYKPYPRDVEKVKETLAARQNQLSAGNEA